MSSQALSVSLETLRKFCKIIGFAKNENRYINISVGIYLFAVFLYCALFFSQKFNLQNNVENCVPRVGIMRINRQKLSDLFILMETPTESKIKRVAKLSSDLERSLSVLGPFVLTLGITVYVVSILSWLVMGKQNSLPFGALPQWIMNYNNYNACFIFQVTLFALVMTDYLVSDAIKLCIMWQLRTHFKYLTVSIEEVLDDAKKEFCSVSRISSDSVSKIKVPWTYQRKHLKNIILHHNYVIRIASETEDIFNKCVLVTFVNVSFFICTALCRIVNTPLFTAEFWQLCTYIVAACMICFGDYYITQCVLTDNEALAFSCYNVDFVGTSIPFQKCLIFIMARAQRPVRFTIAKFAPISLATIVTVLKATYSYFMLLQNLRKQ